MDTTFLCGVITPKHGGQPEFFNIKVSEDHRVAIVNNHGLRNHIANLFADEACKQLKRDPSTCRASIMPPQGESYTKYLNVLSGLTPEVLALTTIDLSNISYTLN